MSANLQLGLDGEFFHDLSQTSSLLLWICLSEDLHEFGKTTTSESGFVSETPFCGGDEVIFDLEGDEEGSDILVGSVEDF